MIVVTDGPEFVPLLSAPGPLSDHVTPALFLSFVTVVVSTSPCPGLTVWAVFG